MSALRTNTPEPDSHPKLLSSHHSIYNALNNPLLKLSPSPQPDSGSEHATPDRDFEVSSPSLKMPRPLMDDPFAPFSSWHAINLPGASFPDLARSTRLSSPFNSNASRANSASILSNSDEDLVQESLVIVPSLKRSNTNSVLLFETDEEDDLDDEDNTLTANSGPDKRPTKVSKIASSSFIMPRLSLSDDISVKITILHSDIPAWNRDIETLIEFIQKNLASLALRLNHITLVKSTHSAELEIAGNSSSLLVLNDGSPLVSEFLSNMVAHNQGSRIPNVIVVNLMTANYFVNLFDIITSIRPKQIIKTPSLTNAKFLRKMKESGLQELTKPSVAKDDDFEPKQTCPGCEPKNEKSGSKYPNYKALEREFRREFLSSSAYDLVDPLNLATNLHQLEPFLGPLRGVLIDCSSDEDEPPSWFFKSGSSWFILSFSVGMMVGVTLNACSFFELTKRLLFSETKNEVVKFVPRESTARSLAKKITLNLDRALDSLCKSLSSINTVGKNESLVEEVSTKLTTGLKSLILQVYDSANSGLSKIAIMFSNIN